ncbi:MAG: response regulator [Bacteroidales bacterium]|nr:response regulator [Bacteroidales bacterium]
MTEKNKILVVDDSSTNTFLLESFLKGKGYNIITTQSGEEALTILKKEKIDLLLLDIMMPEINGFDILNEIEKDNNLKELKVILVSVLERENRIEKILENKNIDYVQKPIILNNLLFKINNFLN